MGGKQNSGTLSVLMLPWLGQGHISPFIELAKRLTKKCFHVYFCSTPITLASIKKRITDEYSLSIELIELHLPSSPELPPHHHTTNGLPAHLMPALYRAYEATIPNFSSLLNTLNPDLVIHDFNQPWAPKIAASYNIPAVILLTSGAIFPSFVFHTIKKRGEEFPFPAVRLKEFFDNRFRKMFEPKDGGKDGEEEEGDDILKFYCKFILVNSFRELEGKYIDYMSILTEKKIVPVGPLAQDIVAADEKEHGEIMQWLDHKDVKSTVFVSFGSEFFLSKDQIEEVAHGLELSNVNFIWVLRFPVGEGVKVEKALPEGFLERVEGRGLIVDWAPQPKILAHSSTGGFVSHCGWNSIMESLKFGVPIIAMPMQLDQPPNARLVEEIGVAVEVNRNENGGLSRDEIAQAIRKVVWDKTGEDIRTKAREFSEDIKKKGDKDILEELEELVQICKERKSQKT